MTEDLTGLPIWKPAPEEIRSWIEWVEDAVDEDGGADQKGRELLDYLRRLYARL